MSSSDIEALKSAVGAQTDAELAGYLGITRTTISQWRLRGKIPKKYKTLLITPSLDEIRGSLKNAFRIKFYGSVENKFWMAAALPLVIERCKAEKSPVDIEEELIDILSEAATFCELHLKKAAPENNEDVNQVIQHLRASAVVK
ncbi:MAG: helix-turn-helix domain-containing protein [Maricaulaceae bacterium]|nr:helix-turn-helix domain-containing protein [Maricaulaceae bacterium]